MIGDVPNPRKNGDPTPEETDRIVNDILKDFRAKHAEGPLSDTDKAINTAKSIHALIIREARAEIPQDRPLDELLWRKRLMEAYRINFHTHLDKEQMIEVLSVMHTEMALAILR